MTFPKARLIVSAILFISWLGFLLYLVLETKTVFIAKPQFQIAQTVLVVEVRDDGGRPDPVATVKEVLWGDGALAGRKLQLSDLLACKKEHGYGGAEEYVIPLMERSGAWQITPIPIPQGYRPLHPSHGTLEIRRVGPDPDCVLKHGILPRRMPFDEALALKSNLETCKAEVELKPEEVRIYRWTPEVREQVEAVLVAKKQ